MRQSRRPMVIATRRSPLAKVQAELIGDAYAQFRPDIDVLYRSVDDGTDGDHDPSREEASDKDRFVRAVEKLVLDGSADLAVHSYKDVPIMVRADAKGLVVIAVPPRGDSRDCLIGQNGPMGIGSLPQSATVGTSSPRRAAQLLRLRPDLNVRTIAGNVQTRLRLVTEQRRYDATVLAAAGLQRLGLDEYAATPLESTVMLPAAGQGALAVQCRADDHATVRRCLPLNDAASAAAVNAERQVVTALGGGCHQPIAAHFQADGDRVQLHARVLSMDGSRCVEAVETAPPEQDRKLVDRVVAALRDRGACDLLSLA